MKGKSVITIQAAIGLLVKSEAADPLVRGYIRCVAATVGRPVTDSIEARAPFAAVFRVALGPAGEPDSGASALRREMAKLPKAVARYIRGVPAFTITRLPLSALRRWLNEVILHFRAQLAPEPRPTDPLGSTPHPALATISLSSPKPPPSPLGRRRSPRAPPLEPSRCAHSAPGRVEL